MEPPLAPIVGVGFMEEIRTIISDARLRQLNPALRVSTLKNVLGPYRRAEDLSRYEEGLRQAGPPE